VRLQKAMSLSGGTLAPGQCLANMDSMLDHAQRCRLLQLAQRQPHLYSDDQVQYGGRDIVHRLYARPAQPREYRHGLCGDKVDRVEDMAVSTRRVKAISSGAASMGSIISHHASLFSRPNTDQTKAAWVFIENVAPDHDSSGTCGSDQTCDDVLHKRPQLYHATAALGPYTLS
jgi:hypothetical protein